ncbi:amidohydrolase [Auricularia subglabra TFB-10046 SS5]|nr:amidohydrolase [Auricularia subglabra TFB-10046 SS5]
MHSPLAVALVAALLATHCAHASLNMQDGKILAYGEELGQDAFGFGDENSASGDASRASPRSILLKGGTVIAFDAETESLDILRDTSVHIIDDRISGLYGAADLSSFSAPIGTEVVDVAGHIVSPGFVDTHRHGWQTAFKTLGANTSLPEYFIRFVSMIRTPDFSLTPEDVYIGTIAGLYEALNSGVTTILDHAHHTWSRETSAAGLDASIDCGLRVMWAYTIHTQEDFTTKDQMEDVRALYEKGRWRSSATTIGISYDELTAHPPEVVKEVFDLATDINASAFTVHYLGGPWGDDGLPGVVHKQGFLNRSIPVVFSHASFLSATDIGLLRDTDQFISITPESEMHYGHDHPNTHLIMDQAALGVDTHFTFSTDIVGQARLWLQRTRVTQYAKRLRENEIAVNNPMSANQAFLLATRNGGRALRREDVGVIRVGAKADVVVFDGESPNMLGWRDPVAAVILHSHVSDVKHVLVDGQFRKRDGRIVHGDWKAVKERFLKSCERIQTLWEKRWFPEWFEGRLRGAGLGVKVPTVDVVRGEGTGY